MRKYLFLLAGISVIMASCASDNTYQVQRAQIDICRNANVSRHDAENAIKKDSILRTIEKQKADSIINQKESERKKSSADKSGPPNSSH